MLGVAGRRIALGFLAAAVLAAGAARAQDAPITKGTTVEGITEYRLANGLRVLLFPDPSRPKVTVNMTIFVGSRHEGYGEAGMAHLLEHMAFKGTPTHPDIPGLMKERGAQFNGTTWVDRTNYYETLPASDGSLEFAIKLEADRLINCPIKAEDLATEFSVVRNEFESGENDPTGILTQRMEAVAYEWHNYGKSTIGNRADIERVPVDNLRAFYKKYYQPDNALLIVAGNFDQKKALELIQKYFGSLPRPERTLQETYTEEPAQDGERSVTLRRVGDVGVVGLLYHVPAASHPDFPAVQLLSNILSTQPSGRLYKALVETKKAASVSAYAYNFKDPGVMEMLAEVNTKDPAVLESVRDEMIELVQGIGATGVTAEEVDRARTQLLKQRELAAADPNNLAVALSDWAAQGDWRLYFLNRDRLEKVTPADVQDVATRYLQTSNRTVGMYIPTAQPERTPIPATPEIAQLVEGYKGREGLSGGELVDTAPLALEARIIRPDSINGVKVALLPKDTRGDLVQLSLNLHYGDANSLKGLTTAAEFLGPMLQRGTEKLTRQQIQDTLDKNLAQLSVGGDAGTLSVNLQTKRENLPAVLEVLQQVLRAPTFPESEFETLKAQQIAQLEQNRTEPTFLASNRMQRLLSKYPADDVRYVPTIDEQAERLNSLTLDQIKALHQEYLGAGHGELAAVGDFEPAELLAGLKPILEGWSSSKPYARIDNPFQAGIEATTERIITPDKANAIYLSALPIQMKDSSPEYPAMTLGGYILGGGALSSRIADRLRQKDGLSYGAGASFNAPALDDRGRITVFAIYNPGNLDKVATGVDEELTRWVDGGVTTEELDKARSGYLQQRQIMRSNDRMLSGMIATQLYNDRTFQFEADQEQAIRGLTPESINQTIKKIVDPSKRVIVNAGDFKTGDGK